MKVNATAIAVELSGSRPMEGSPWTRRWRRRRIFQMVWPAAIESTLNYLVGVVVLAMMGRLGPQAVGAVGISTRVLQVFWALSQTLTVGATVFVARAVGQGDANQARRVTATALRWVVLGGSVGALLLWWAALPIVRLFGANADLLAEGALYLRYSAGSVLVNGVLLVAGACLRGAGDARTPMVVAAIVNVLNAFGQFALVFGRWGFPAWGLAGSALAMVAAQAAGAAFMLGFLSRPNSTLFLRPTLVGWHVAGRHPAQLKVHSPSLARQIARLGFPASLEMLFWQVGQIVLTILVVHFGTVALAAHQLGIQAEGLSYMPAAGFAVAATTLVGQALGSGQRDEAHWTVKEIACWSGGFTLVTALFLFVFPGPIMRLLTNDQAVIAIGVYYLMIMAFVEIPQQLTGVLSGALRGMGDTRSPMFIAAAGIWLVRLPLAVILGRLLGLGILGVWWAMAVDLAFRFALALWRYDRARRQLLSSPVAGAASTIVPVSQPVGHPNSMTPRSARADSSPQAADSGRISGGDPVLRTNEA